MSIRNILIVILFIGLGIGANCSNSPILSGLSEGNQIFEGIVGDYIFTTKDRLVEKGILIADEAGRIVLVPDRGSFVVCNWWLKVEIKYLNPSGYTMGLPLYYPGDTIEYKLVVDYGRGLPLDVYPILYAKLVSQQRTWPEFEILRGGVRVYDPLLISPFGYVEISEEFYVPFCSRSRIICHSVQIWLEFLGGSLELNLYNGTSFWYRCCQ